MCVFVLQLSELIVGSARGIAASDFYMLVFQLICFPRVSKRLLSFFSFPITPSLCSISLLPLHHLSWRNRLTF